MPIYDTRLTFSPQANTASQAALMMNEEQEHATIYLVESCAWGWVVRQERFNPTWTRAGQYRR